MTGPMRYDELDDTGELWGLYRTAFEPIEALAVQQHMMARDEFDKILGDKRIQKWTVAEGPFVPCALAVITNDLAAWPLISPKYFERRWPLEYAERRIWYTGFVAVAEGAPPFTFPRLINAMAEQIVAVKGICSMDFCARNVLAGLPNGSHRAIKRTYPDEECERIDSQEFWAYFPAGRPDPSAGR